MPSYTYEDGDKGWKVECDVEGTVVPYTPATREEPADGGYLEDVNFAPMSFHLQVGKTWHEVKLTPALEAGLSAEVKEAYDGDDSMQADVYALFTDL